MYLLLHLCTLYIVLVPCQGAYPGAVYLRMCAKLVYLDRELLRDAIRKYERVQIIKNYYRKSYSFQIAKEIYEIRRKFRRMVKVYEVTFDNLQYQDHNAHFPRLLEAKQLSMTLDHMSESILEREADEQRKQLERERRQKSGKKSNLTATNPPPENGSLLRAGKPMWVYKSLDSWGRPYPRQFRTPLPIRVGRAQRRLFRSFTKRVNDDVPMNY